MELVRSNLYVFSETSPNNGKWIISSCGLKADGTLEVKLQNDDKVIYHLSSNIVVQAPNDTVWHRTPPLPFRRSVKETLSLHVKKGSTTWFLASSEEERNQWFKTITSFTNRQPPPYGDYDNWTYPPSHLDSETGTRPTKPFHPRKSLTPTHRSGFYSIEEPSSRTSKERHSGLYSVQEPRRSSGKFPELPITQHRSGFYSVQESRSETVQESKNDSVQGTRRGSGRFPDVVVPQRCSGFYSVQGKGKKVPKELEITPTVPPVEVRTKKERPADRVCCGWRCVAWVCNLFSVCFQHCCLNFAAAI